MSQYKKNPLLRFFLIFLVIVFSIILFIYRKDVQKIAHLGYGGIFLLSILTNATLIFPLPGVVITSAMGAVFSPFWVALAAGTGAALGETTGYLAGFSGRVIVDRKEWYETLTHWMRKYGSLTILIMAIIPNPFFDLAGMAAGMLKLPYYQFLFWCSIGKILKMLIFAYTGASIFKIFSTP
ncbi:MAG: VTT domain-containing protein [Anaerolineaceae bacterium]|nr:VTT domain-containing protein [Anaerolineaceae bacterium]